MLYTNLIIWNTYDLDIALWEIILTSWEKERKKWLLENGMTEVLIL